MQARHFVLGSCINNPISHELLKLFLLSTVNYHLVYFFSCVILYIQRYSCYALLEGKWGFSKRYADKHVF
jgi:hypothetical protein